jgi:hypothetical protein
MADKKKPDAKTPLPEELECLESARGLTLEWALSNHINIRDMDLVTPSILIHKRFAVWLFYTTDALLQQYETGGETHQIKEQYIANLQKLKCPEEYLSGVIFFIDSDENVKRYADLKPVDY